MRSIATVLLAALVNSLAAQVFNFYGTEYYLSPDASSAPGTVLTPSGTDLSAFNFSTADPMHAMFTTGLYFPVVDCAGRNLWVRLQHVAHDPNGTGNGYNIAQTLNSPFLPTGSTDRIGGWAGFLYDMLIIADQTLTGPRSYILDVPHPTNITVASLETLYNDGTGLHEWLSFEIFDAGSSGWELNSINFTGINPFSMPGFSAELNYATTATSTTPPTGFSTTFPTGSLAVYAVDLNLSNAEHSEFQMTAGGISHFRYGYEFHPGGYQGMSISFGEGPVLNLALSDPLCPGYENGIIAVTATGEGPFSYAWSTGGSGPEEGGLAAGEYILTVTDGLGCQVQDTIILIDPPILSGSIVLDNGTGTDLLIADVTGGTGAYTYEWNNGSTNVSLQPVGSGSYSVTVTDGNGCQVVLQYLYVGVAHVEPLVPLIYPNPSDGRFTVRGDPRGGWLQLFDASGRQVIAQRIAQGTHAMIDATRLRPGVYVCTYQEQDHVIVIEPH